MVRSAKEVSMKKAVYSVLCAVMLFTLFASVCCAQAECAVSAKEAIVVAENGEVLWEKNSTDKRPIASMTKIMTLLCVYDAIDQGKISLDDTVVASERAASMGGSQVFLDANARYKVDALVKSVVVCSANDSCVALAEKISGSVEAFVQTMNDKARALGMDNTLFENCTGLPAVSQHSCAKDVATMMLQLIKHPHYFECAKIWTEDFVHPSGRVTGMTNTNKLVRFYSGCDGGKTGYTSEAKHCLSATACRNGMRVVAVVVGADDSKTRFKEVSSLFDFAFANYENKVYLPCGQTVGETAVKGGKQSSVAVVAADKLQHFGKRGMSDCELKTTIVPQLSAPVAQGDVVGKAELICNGRVVCAVDLVAQSAVDSKSFWDYLKDIV